MARLHSGRGGGSRPRSSSPLHRILAVISYGFRRRFTEDEKTDIEMASLDVTTAPLANRKRAAALRVYMQDVLAATYIDLKNAYVRNGLLKLEQFGILPVGRALTILDTVRKKRSCLNDCVLR